MILDLGCGTGNDGIDILSRNNRVIYIGIDASNYMIEEAYQKFVQYKMQNRCLFLNCDFQFITLDSLSTRIIANFSGFNVACVLSALALHHSDVEFRRNLYMLAGKLLLKGGVLILTDLYTNSIGICSQLAPNQEVREIRQAIRYCENTNMESKRGTTLSVDHYTNANRPPPLLQETPLLRNSGFENVDVAYRNGQLCILIAEKESL
jgi:SAM-dependent methyltransferase